MLTINKQQENLFNNYKQIKKGRNQLITTLSIYSCVQITQL